MQCPSCPDSPQLASHLCAPLTVPNKAVGQPVLSQEAQEASSEHVLEGA